MSETTLISRNINGSFASEFHDVVVIGGGAAGLATAYDLRKNGYDVILLEEQNYPGGRISTVHSNGFHAESGGAVITEGEAATLNLLNELSVGPLIDLGLHGLDLFMGKKTVHLTRMDGRVGGPRDLWSLIRFAFAAGKVGPNARFPGPGLLLGYRAALKAIKKEKVFLKYPYDPNARANWDTTTFAEFLDRFHPSLREFVDLQLQVTAGEISDRISLFWGLLTFNWNIEGSFYWLNDGAASFPLTLAAKLGDRVRLNSRVASVKSGSEVLIEYSGEAGPGTLTAKAVVLAVPPSAVLRIVSDLEEGKKKALAAVPFGSYIVIHFICRKNFWADKIKGGYLNCSTTVFADILDSTRGQKGEGGIISCFIAGPEARRLIDASDPEIISEVERDLERVFPGALQHVTGRMTKRWHEAIPYFNPGYGQLIERLKQPQGRMFFCGDYTEGAGIHDAVVSGLRSSEEVARFLSVPTK
jgi:oxygen-dependent protoporphyrinogen oxidase